MTAAQIADAFVTLFEEGLRPRAVAASKPAKRAPKPGRAATA